MNSISDNPETAVSVADQQRAIIDDFSLLDNWLDRYQYLIDLGKGLPELKPEEMVDDNLLDGCQSRVWLIAEGDADAIELRANSDAAIVSGLIALLLKIYSGRSARDILETEPEFISALGLDRHLSPTRANGLHAMLNRIKAEAAGRV